MNTILVESRYLKDIEIGRLTAKYSADGSRILRYYIDLRLKPLNIHKELSAPELFLVQHKVNALVAQWDDKMAEHQRKSAIWNGRSGAEQLTVEAAMALERLNSLLRHTLTVNDQIDWETLKDHSQYSGKMTFDVPEPHHIRRSEPHFYAPRISFWDTILGRKKHKIKGAADAHNSAMEKWRAAEQDAERQLVRRKAEWLAEKIAFESKAQAERDSFYGEQSSQNSRIDQLAAGVMAGEPQAVVEHTTMVLDASDYDDLFEKAYEIEYQPSTKTLLVEFRLPSPDEMPTLKTVRFVAATGELKDSHISEREQKANYDHVGYQICLRTLHELFEADEYQNLERILFNGYATYIDRSSGRDVSATIMSILVDRATFLEIDLSRIDPKACFKSLKGVSASALSALAPIPPVMKLNKEDRRFIEARDQAANIDDSTNLASMDWEDFEHLVREVFEKEFASRGGEVRITQSSSDGGVDAVAFDPDPITGGKIVIQAKRYTRTVGVAAVRDLYGTMQHEQASRGILVTTADYGPDAHKFSSGKPITLMTGSNLLHLLGKHGIKAKIDLQEARKDLNLRVYGQ